MADRVIKVIGPATTYDLMSLSEIKVIFGIPDTDTSQDELLSEYITQYSDVIATFCNRVFAYETVTEVWRCVNRDDTNAMTRIFVSHYPIDPAVPITLETPSGSAIDTDSYVIEERSGKIELFQSYAEPIRVTYAGGYLLPDECPPALKQALALMMREGMALMQRLAVSGIRSIAHKESRVMYFDSTAAGQPGRMGTISSPMIGMTAANSLLMHYVRLEV